VVTNPAIFLAACAQITNRIKLGPAISVLTFRNPLLVAEDYAMVDQLSGGRLVMGVGSGYLKHEFEALDIDGAEKRERFDDSLAILRQAWSGEPVTFDGKFHQVHDVPLNVHPLQQSEPPIYVAVLRSEAAYHVGRQGNRLMSVPYASVDTMEEIGPLIADYQRGYDSGAPQIDDPVLVALHTHVAESDAEAREHAAEAFDLYVETRLYAKSQVYDDIWKSRLGLFGSVDRVVGQLVELHDLGLRHVLLLMNFGAMPAEDVARSMRLIAAEVVPRVNERLGKAAAA
jgi:alkanesulfonate monooxygenase SsuD/methylene tetrahydromethanopterin reductase-like flavin-dependent oxidoreductase (luciferase family)